MDQQAVGCVKTHAAVIVIERGVDHRQAVIEHVKVLAVLTGEVVDVAGLAILDHQVSNDRVTAVRLVDLIGHGGHCLGKAQIVELDAFGKGAGEGLADAGLDVDVLQDIVDLVPGFEQRQQVARSRDAIKGRSSASESASSAFRPAGSAG